jgi:excinuclease ABC subunit C
MDSTGQIQGAPVIAAFVKTLPSQPGVYRMLDEKGDALYVGKAKSLKKRVVAYTQPEKQVPRIQRMIALTRRMEFTVTHTEAEALLLESNLIKKLKPRYNILLRDDKSFPYIFITGHAFPQVTKHRGAKEKGGEYFGPFASGYAVNEALAVLQKAFRLRNCTDGVFAQRTRPCLQYQIKRCTAPCVAKVTEEEYGRQVDMARRFLQGKSRAIQEDFAKRMQQASENTDYEAAAEWRDRIRALTQIQAHQAVNVEGVESADIHAVAQRNGVTCVQMFFFRNGHNFGSRCYFPRHEKDETPENVLSAFIGQFYADKPVPSEVVVSHEIENAKLIEDALRLKAERKVSLVRPSRGARRELVEMALKNAQEALAHKLAQDADAEESLARLAETFGLEAPPERIEVYDNSHTGGRQALGAMIVAGPEGFRKSAYRKFNMKRASGEDDYAMMREMLSRRFARADEENLPDLVLIDGGLGQLSAARQAMADAGASDIPVASIAKGPDRNAGRETFFLPGREPFTLPPADPLLYYLQRLRDEAHRFAITSHRARRGKTAFQNPLDQVSGIGAKRKKALLLHFGSAKAVAEAGVADLEKVDGISRAVAEKIYGFFHES